LLLLLRLEACVRCSALGEGVEYLLADSQPPHLFILRKLYRHGGGAITTLAFYYVLDGSVYQAPSLQAALLARMVRGRRGERGAVGRFVSGQRDAQHSKPASATVLPHPPALHRTRSNDACST
jgi:hypothetical protein